MDKAFLVVILGSLALYGLDLLLYGFLFGFGGFLALCVVSGAVCWFWSKVPPYQPGQSVWRVERFGSRFYWMEVL